MTVALDWESIVLAALASLRSDEVDDASGARLRACAEAVERLGKPWHRLFLERLDGDLADPVTKLAARLELRPAEVASVVLAAAVESDLRASNAVARLQVPIGGGRPCFGLLASLFGVLARDDPLEELACGAARRCGLLVAEDTHRPLVERPVHVPEASALSIRGGRAPWPGTRFASRVDLPRVTPELRDGAARAARTLVGARDGGLVVRTASIAEGRALCALIAEYLGREPLFLDRVDETGVVPYLVMHDLQPVVAVQPLPGETSALPEFEGLGLPLLVICGPDGDVACASGRAHEWRVPTPRADERIELWRAELDHGELQAEGALAEEMGRCTRWSCGEVAELAARSRHEARLRGGEAVESSDVEAAAWHVAGRDLGGLAEAVNFSVPDDALVVTPELRSELESLLLRCRSREDLARGLGAAARARYRPGVRALFSGPSGTGKTLAASWLAQRLRIPLFRADLASVTSKYIGETEKHLSSLFARAERSEMVLLFDEADAMFGQRTEGTRDATDRFANAQTNYLLQRIESFDGIVVLTTNSRGSLDTAFTRRLDAVLEFAMPGPEERRGLWWAHLGEASTLTEELVNRLAARTAIAGGSVRNIVLGAAVLARKEERPIAWPDISRALEAEHRKLGRPVSNDLLAPQDLAFAARRLDGGG